MNENKVHLNNAETIEFAKIFCKFLLQDLYRADNNGNIVSGSEKSSTVLGISNSIPGHNIYDKVSQSDSFPNSSHKFIRKFPIFKKTHEIPSKEELYLNSVKLWKMYIVKTGIG